MNMVAMAAAEVVFVAGGIILYIWRWQYTFPDSALILLGFLVLTFFIHRDGLRNLGLGSRGFVAGMKTVGLPTLVIAAVLIIYAAAAGHLPRSFFTPDKYQGLWDISPGVCFRNSDCSRSLRIGFY